MLPSVDTMPLLLVPGFSFIIADGTYSALGNCSDTAHYKLMCNGKHSGLSFNGEVKGMGKAGCHLPDYS